MEPINRIDWKKFPPATYYDRSIEWPTTHPAGVKTVKATKRNTFMDDIFKPKNVAAVPGTGRYNLLPTDEQIKSKNMTLRTRKIKVGERDTPFSQTEFLSIKSPGSGYYNPHDSVTKLKQ